MLTPPLSAFLFNITACTYPVKPPITDPPKSGQPLYSGWPDWFYHRTNAFRTAEKQTHLNPLRTMDTDRPPTYLSQYKIYSKNGQWSYTRIMWTLVDRFCMQALLLHGFSTVAHHASLSRQHKATERSENVTSSRSTITPTGSNRMPVTDTLNILDPQWWSFPLFSQMKFPLKQQSSVYLVLLLIIASFYISYASSIALAILLLKIAIKIKQNTLFKRL